MGTHEPLKMYKRHLDFLSPSVLQQPSSYLTTSTCNSKLPSSLSPVRSLLPPLRPPSTPPSSCLPKQARTDFKHIYSSIPISQCNTGDAQCCNSVTKASDPSTAALLGLLGIVVQGVDVLVGLTCTPITVIGVGQGANW